MVKVKIKIKRLLATHQEGKKNNRKRGIETKYKVKTNPALSLPFCS
jgi:hypothetical protein